MVLRPSCFILAMNPFRDPRIASAMSVQTPTIFSNFMPFLPRNVATTWNTASALVIVSRSTNQHSLSVEEGPTKWTWANNWDNWEASVVSSHRIVKKGDACIFLRFGHLVSFVSWSMCVLMGVSTREIFTSFLMFASPNKRLTSVNMRSFISV